MDVVYPIREGEPNEPLRYSLRGLAAHLEHDRVWLVGGRPSWCSDRVRHLPTDQSGTKWQNSTLNLRTAVEHPEVSDVFVLMNDDFFILDPVREVPTLHRGTVRGYVAGALARHRSTYRRGLEETARAIRRHLGVDDPLCYELHVPLVVDKAKMRASLELAERLGLGVRDAPLHKRTFYGNHHAIGGVEANDVKVSFTQEPWPFPRPFVSTATRGWRGHTGRTIRELLTKPSRYEWVDERGRCTLVPPREDDADDVSQATGRA